MHQTHVAVLSNSRKFIATVVAGLVVSALLLTDSAANARPRDLDRAAARLDRVNLRLAADAIEAQAERAGAVQAPPTGAPAVVLYESLNALLELARAQDPARIPRRTLPIMGAIPFNLRHELTHRPSHSNRTVTHTLDRWRHRVGSKLSGGWGLFAHHGFTHPVRPQDPDGVYVEPKLPTVQKPTVASVAIRKALSKLGTPYVWAASGPATFDCSGLTMWAYAHAGIRLGHYTGWQWQEGRLVPPADALPGDLVLIGSDLHHVGMYLGAGWMINAPLTGHYVDVVPVPKDVAGLIRP